MGMPTWRSRRPSSTRVQRPSPHRSTHHDVSTTTIRNTSTPRLPSARAVPNSAVRSKTVILTLLITLSSTISRMQLQAAKLAVVQLDSLGVEVVELLPCPDLLVAPNVPAP